jgi:hypothetical protein
VRWARIALGKDRCHPLSKQSVVEKHMKCQIR